MLTEERIDEMIEEVEALKAELANAGIDTSNLDEASDACDTLVTRLMNLSNDV